MSEDLMDDLWETEEETTQDKRGKNRGKEKHPRQRTPELNLKGFSCRLGTIKKKRMNKETHKLEIVNAEVTIAKDPRCWVLRIGSDVTYPTTLTHAILALASQDIEIEGTTTADEVIAALAETKDRIVERIADLERKVEEWDKTEHYKEIGL